MELGISSYTYVWAVGVPGYPLPSRPMTCAGLLDHALSLGVHVVQIADNLPLSRWPEEELDRLGERARAAGIRLEAGTCGIRPEDLLPYLRIATRLGAPILRTLIDGPSHRPNIDEAGTLLRNIAPEFERAGVRIAVENHDRFPASALRQVMEKANSRSVGICLDTANSMGCGECVGEVLDELSDYVINLHIKDFSVRRLPHKKGFLIEGAPAGTGVVDIPRLLRRIQELGCEMSVILEQWPPLGATVEESVATEERWARESIRYLRTLISEPNRDAA